MNDQFQLQQTQSARGRRNYRQATSQFPTKWLRPFEEVRLSHTVLGVIATTRNGVPLGRPMVTWATCRKTGKVGAIHVGVDKSLERAVLACLRGMHMRRKSGKKSSANLLAIKRGWPACRKPKVMVVDNDPALHGRAFQDACAQLGLLLLYSGPGARADVRFQRMLERFQSSSEGRLSAAGLDVGVGSRRGSVITIQSLSLVLSRLAIEVHNCKVERQSSHLDCSVGSR